MEEEYLWRVQQNALFPEYDVELSFVESLMDVRDFSQALEHIEDLIRDGFDRPQLLCVLAAQCCMELGRLRESRAYLQRCDQLPEEREAVKLSCAKQMLRSTIHDEGWAGISLVLGTTILATVTFLGVQAKNRA